MYKNYTTKSGRNSSCFRRILFIMRLTTAILLVSLIQVSAATFAQRLTYKQKSTTLIELFNVIKIQTGYNVVWNESMLDKNLLIEVNFKNTPINEVMKSSLKNLPVDFSIVKNTVVLKTRELSVFDELMAKFKEIDVEGNLVDEKGNEMAGATVTIKGTKRSVRTSNTGHFSLTNTDEKAILVISYLGYDNLEIPVKADLGTITMVIAEGKLSEVNVTVNTGYQRLPKERSAGSFSVITKETLEKRSNYQVFQYLSGQLPGLMTGANFLVRGQSTLTSNTDPLIVVDGFIVNYGLESISPNDIESITLLKDASAASIWGVRAANGVIVIQSKRNSPLNRPLEISFNSSLSFTQKPDLSKLPLANATSFLEYEKYKADSKLVAIGVAPFRAALSQGLDAFINNPTNAASITEGLKGNNVLNEFSDLFMQQAIRQQYGFSVAGKGPKSYTRTSFNYDDVQSSFKKTGNNRFMGDLYQKNDLTSKLSVELGLNLLMMNYKTNGMSVADLQTIAPYQRILDDNGNYVSQPRGIYQADKDAWVKKGYYNWDYNLKQEFDNNNALSTSQYVSAMAGINYTILKGFSFNSGYKFEFNRADNTLLDNDQTYNIRNQVNYGTKANASNVLVYGFPKGAYLSNNFGKGQTQIFRNQLKYDGKVINDDHQVTAIAGMEVQQVNSTSSGNSGYGYDVQTEAFTPIANDAVGIFGTPIYLQNQISLSSRKDRYVSYYANAGYTINGSARQDRTNLFGATANFRNVILWSTGLSWQAHKESFLQNSPFSSLIFRASYGVNGNVDRSTSPFLIANIAAADRNTTNLPYAYVTNPENPALRWEKTAVANIGIDFITLKGRVSGSVEYYNKKSTDLLGNATVNGTYGFNSAYINYASMKNKGIDVSLNAQILKGIVYLNTTINYSYNKNKVTDVQFPESTAGSFITGAPQTGLPLNYLYGYKWAGLSPATGVPQIYDAAGKIVEYTSEMTDPLALDYLGSRVPSQYGGVFTTIGYKKLSITAGLTYNAGHKFRIPVISYSQLYNVTATGALSSDWDNRWKTPGDEGRTNIPAMPSSSLSLGNYDSYSTYANVNVQDAANIRFQELILNYQLPASIFSKTPKTIINVGLQVRNLGVYTFNKGKLDPDHLSYSYSSNLPPPPEFTFMLKANF